MDIAVASAGSSRRSKPARLAALSPAIVTLVTLIAQNILGHAPVADRIAVGIGVAVTAGVGATVAYLKPDNACGWLLGGAAAIAHLGILAQEFAQAGSSGADEPSGQLVAVAWIASWPTLVAAGLLLSLFLRFPTGSVATPHWRIVEFGVVVAVAAGVMSTALMPGPFDATPRIDNPLGIASLQVILAGTEDVTQSLLTAVALASVASAFVRYRRAGVAERQQLKWVLFAIVVLAVAVVFTGVIDSAGALNEASFFVAVAGFVALPASMGIAILRYRLFDIDILINRTIVYTVMTTGVIGFYIGVVGTLTGVIGRNVDLGASLVATGVVAVAFNPVREGLQRLVNRVMFGRRDDPYAVVAQLGHELESVVTPSEVMPAIAEALALSLRLPYVAVALHESGDRTLVAEHGIREGSGESFALSHHGERVGELVVRPRVGSQELSPRDRELLEDLTRQIAPAAHAVRLTEALRRSRGSIVRARAEERRRLRRDLHDGLGPELAGIALGISAANQSFDEHPQSARLRLDKVEQQLRAAIANVRTIVAGLVPPELERLGLIGALREKALMFSDTSTLKVVVTGEVEGIDAAEELAAYRIALEALTNAAKHSGASECTIQLWKDDALYLEVTDNGTGVAPEAPSGTGIASMRERAEEIGGTLIISTDSSEGTVVRARLPVSLS